MEIQEGGKPWLTKGQRHFNFTKRNASGGANICGGDGDTPAKAWANMGMPGGQFAEWQWYEIDDAGQPVKGFDHEGYPIKSQGDE